MQFDPAALGVSPGHEEWVAKLFNVATMLGALQLFVVLDTYRSKDVAASDLVLEGFARLDVAAIIVRMQGARLAEIDPAADAALAQALPASSVKHVLLYRGVAHDVDVGLDVRFLNKKLGALVEGGAMGEPTSTLVHTDSRWQRAHLLHVFLQQVPVLTVVVPTLASLGNAVERSKRALLPVALVHTVADAEYEEEEEPAPAKRASEAPADPAPKKKAKAAPAPAALE